jgi:hypothetical protein
MEESTCKLRIEGEDNIDVDLRLSEQEGDGTASGLCLLAGFGTGRFCYP